jgi:predicted esterase
LLLHGTGGTEDDLLPLGKMLAPGAALLSPRGQVLERGAPRFFRRLAEGVFDVPDLRARAGDLARFVRQAADAYGFAPGSAIAVGYSNGANIASATMLLHPGILRGAVLFRGMLPFETEPSEALAGTRVLLSNGRRDPIVPRATVDQLAATLRSAGADVTQHWQESGHELTQEAVDGARDWLAAKVA